MQTVRFCRQTPLVDLLPVLKSRWYLGEFQPLLYARLALTEGRGLFVDLMSFLRDPSQGGARGADCAAVSFDFSGSRARRFSAVFLADGSSSVFQNRDLTRAFAFDPAFSYRGNDEQGWYWGVRFLLDGRFFDRWYETGIPSPKDRFFGNVYTFSKDSGTPYFGAVSPVVTDDIFAPENDSVFLIGGETHPSQAAD